MQARFFLPTYGVTGRDRISGCDLANRQTRGRAGLNRETVTNLAMYCALVGMLGAKLVMFLVRLADLPAESAEIFTIETLQAAGVYQGGLMLAFVFALRVHAPQRTSRSG